MDLSDYTRCRHCSGTKHIDRECGCQKSSRSAGVRCMPEMKTLREQQSVTKELVDVCERLLEAIPYVSDYDVPIGLWDDLKQALSKARGDVNE